VADATLTALQTAVGYTFSDGDLLHLALTHRSHSSENDSVDSYERLEFLGDAVLQLAVTHYLYDEYPELPEGEMAKVRAAVVNERSLAQIARGWRLGEALLLGRGEELTGGREKESILSDVVESILGAVYLEGGFAAAKEVVLRHWMPLVDERAAAPGRRDYKTRLQERIAQSGARPRYEVDDTGPEHAKEFTAQVYIDDELLGTGTGTSKKRAEQAAARAAAEALGLGDA
jgi:ribonuclease-3